ncbi:Gfo/Idh/MocA family oxidoreductase [Acidiferrimicrobium sp. IK]|uniref:Gfo/Idh/MocA family protein n=1 Tax=Acidiferrimicrobium sp. IK TaxID=2871700 RepID=UPI0021CB2F95|nr:Gfo/Idh/MocA family oxidoreductase [Acidiferrimicrobium sp. IK]MCU4183325.1 Gfo/Idh/MocA family oxidoreductase [Acidiferrimicrobium sp. IK]
MTIRLSILSGVRHARDYLEVLRRSPDFDLVGVSEDEQAPDWAVADSRAVADAAGVAFVDPDTALASSDAVLVCSEATRHARLAARCVRAGRHVLVDKPAAVSGADLVELTDAASDAPGVIVSSIHRLLSPAVARARRDIDAGRVGLPLSFDAEWIASGGLDGTAVERPGLVCDPALAGGGELTNFGWYPVLALHHLSGLEVVEVFGFGAALFSAAGAGWQHADFGVEDSATVSLKLENAVTATITVARVPAGVSHEAVGSTIRVVGSHGSLVIDEGAPSLSGRRVGGSVERSTIGLPSGDSALRACFADFARAVRGEAPPCVTLEDISRAVRVQDAARKSIATGRPVTVLDAGRASRDPAEPIR